MKRTIDAAFPARADVNTGAGMGGLDGVNGALRASAAKSQRQAMNMGVQGAQIPSADFVTYDEGATHDPQVEPRVNVTIPIAPHPLANHDVTTNITNGAILFARQSLGQAQERLLQQNRTTTAYGGGVGYTLLPIEAIQEHIHDLTIAQEDEALRIRPVDIWRAYNIAGVVSTDVADKTVNKKHRNLVIDIRHRTTVHNYWGPCVRGGMALFIGIKYMPLPDQAIEYRFEPNESFTRSKPVYTPKGERVKYMTKFFAVFTDGGPPTSACLDTWVEHEDGDRELVPGHFWNVGKCVNNIRYSRTNDRGAPFNSDQLWDLGTCEDVKKQMQRDQIDVRLEVRRLFCS